MALKSFFVGLGFEVLLVVVKSRGKLMASESALDLAVLDELEVGVGFDQLLKLGLFAICFWVGLGLCAGGFGFVCLVV